MDKGGEDNLLSDTPGLIGIKLARTQEPSRKRIRAEGQLGPERVVGSEVEPTAPCSEGLYPGRYRIP